MSVNGIGAIGARLLGLRQALRLLARRPWVATASVFICAVALYLPLLLLACADAVGPLAAGAKVAPELSLFVAPGTGSAEIKGLQSRAQVIPGVIGVRLIGRDAALAELRGRAPAGAPLPELTPNPLPDVLVVQMAPQATRSELDGVAAALRKLPRVESVQFDGEWYRKLAALLRVGAGVGVLLALWATALVVAILIGAVRIQADAATTELRVLQLVGADAAFIRRPYVYAGALVLLLAGIGSLGLVVATRYGIGPLLHELGEAYGASFDLPTPQPPLVAGVLAACFLFGALGAWIGTRTAPSFPK